MPGTELSTFLKWHDNLGYLLLEETQSVRDVFCSTIPRRQSHNITFSLISLPPWYYSLPRFWAENTNCQLPEDNPSARLWLRSLVDWTWLVATEKVRAAGERARPLERLQMCPLEHARGLCVEVDGHWDLRPWRRHEELEAEPGWAWENLRGEHLWAIQSTTQTSLISHSQELY